VWRALVTFNHPIELSGKNIELQKGTGSLSALPI
jgi:hypothetical protein